MLNCEQYIVLPSRIRLKSHSILESSYLPIMLEVEEIESGLRIVEPQY